MKERALGAATELIEAYSAELRHQMETQVQRLNSLATTARAVTTLGSLDEVLRVICVQAQALLGATLAQIAAPVDGTGMIKCIMSTGATASDVQDLLLPIDASICGAVLQSGCGQLVDDLQTDPRANPAAKALSTAHSLLYQPLQHQGMQLGVLIVGNDKIGSFDQADLDYLERYAEYAAVAIANARLHSEQQRQQHALAALLRVSEAINSSLDLDTMLQAGLHALDELGLATMAGVSLLNPKRTHIEMRAHLRVPAILVANFGRLELAHLSIVQRALRTGEIQVLTPDEIARYHPKYPGIETVPLNSSIFVPLIADGRPLGTLNVGHIGQPYTEDNLQLLQTIAHQLAQAVVKAQSHQSLLSAAAENAQIYHKAESVRSYLNTLIHTSPDVLLIVRRDLTIHPLNSERAHALWGYLADDITGAELFALVPEPYHPDLRQCLASTEQGRPSTIEIELRRANRSRARVLISCAFLPDYDETLAVCKDVTEQRQIEDHMRQNEKLAALGQMVAGAAHELNNPLAIILGLAQLQRDADMPSAMQADIQGIEDAALRARAIVQQLLTFARAQRPEPQPVAIAALTEAVMARLAATITTNHVQVTVDIAPNLPSVRGDLNQLDQVLFNIMHNALQSLASNPPNMARTMHIQATQRDEMLQLTVSDSGPGIAPAHLSHIFEPFFTTRMIGQGTGLGLAITHAIIQQHQGRISVTSAAGQTMFMIELPITEDLPHAPTPAAPCAPAGSGARILLVEDEELICSVVTRTLTQHHYHVDAVGSGEAALEQALAHDYALIISDLQMPQMDGPTLYEHLCQARPALRWLIITGDTMGERSRAFLEHTQLLALPKPFTREQLLAHVAECIGDSKV